MLWNANFGLKGGSRSTGVTVSRGHGSNKKDLSFFTKDETLKIKVLATHTQKGYLCRRPLTISSKTRIRGMCQKRFIIFSMILNVFNKTFSHGYFSQSFRCYNISRYYSNSIWKGLRKKARWSVFTLIGALRWPLSFWSLELLQNSVPARLLLHVHVIFRCHLSIGALRRCLLGGDNFKWEHRRPPVWHRSCAPESNSREGCFYATSGANVYQSSLEISLEFNG